MPFRPDPDHPDTALDALIIPLVLAGGLSVAFGLMAGLIWRCFGG